MPNFKIAVNTNIISKPGAKPDFGNGIPFDQLTDWQKATRRELSYRMRNIYATDQAIATVIKAGGTITAWHSGGPDCKMPFEIKNGEAIDHICRAKQHRCNANFTLAQHLGADFDNLAGEWEILDHPLVRAYGSIIYHTSSSRPDKPKMRVIFLLSETITDGKLYRKLILAMMWKFEGTPDPACSDYCRLFYGNQGCTPIVTGNILPLEIAMDWLTEYEAYLATRPQPERLPTKLLTPGLLLEPKEEKRRKAFAAAVIQRACDKIISATTGERHYTLKKAAFNLGTFVHGGVISDFEARTALRTAYSIHNRMSDFDSLVEWCFFHAAECPQGLPALDVKKLAEWTAARGYRYEF